MADQLIPSLPRILDATGEPLAGGSVFFFRSGTSEAVTIYADDNQAAELTNPVEIDSQGYIPQVFFAESTEVRAVIRSSTSALVRTIDPLPRATVSSSGADGITYSPTEGNPRDTVQEAIAYVSEAAVEAQETADGAASQASEALSKANATEDKYGTFGTVSVSGASVVRVLDGEAIGFTPPSGLGLGMVLVRTVATDGAPNGTFSGAAIYSLNPTIPSLEPLGGGANFATLDSNVTGSTGANGDATLGITTTQVVYENRTGQSRDVWVTFIGGGEDA